MSYEVILFDIDGTLIRAGGAGRVAMAKTLEQLHGIVQPFVDISYGGRTDLSISRELFDLHGLSWSQHLAREFLQVYAGHFHEALRSRTPLILPGVQNLLDELRNRGRHHMGLLTGNIEACAQIKLNHFQLWEYFDFGGFGDHHEDRCLIADDAFKKAAGRMTGVLQPHKVLVIGDTVADVRCARSIGADVLIVGTGNVPRASIDAAVPDFFHDDLSQLDHILELLLN